MLVLFGIAGRLAAIDGLWTPIYVTGPSMAPTLWGPSRQASCSACGIGVRVHEHPTNPVGQSLDCHHCGNSIEPGEARPSAPDRVLIDRAAYWRRAPQHGELVAIKNEQGTLQVKRVIGVPGDKIGLEGSRLRINGRRVDLVIPPRQIQSIPVFDAAYQGRNGPRWQSSKRGPWSVYHHCSIHDANRSSPIRDDYPANTAVSRQLMPVVHKQLTGRLTTAEPVQVDVDIWLLDRHERFRGRFPAGDFIWSVSSLAAEGVPGMMRPINRWQRIDCSTSKPACESPVSAEAPVAVRVRKSQGGKQATEACLSDLVVSRHFRWYVRRRDRLAWPADPFRLQPQRYFVIGDNLPVSVDSRAEPRGVDRSQIVGRVVRSLAEVDFPSCVTK